MCQNRNGQILYSGDPVEFMYSALADGAGFWSTFKRLKLANFYAAVDRHIKEILGHGRLETTCRYYLGVDHRAAKAAHQKFLVYGQAPARAISSPR